MENEIKLHPLSVKGKYYVDTNYCITDCCCEDIASHNFKIGEERGKNYGAYVFKQPENELEVKQCQDAVFCCPVEAIHDDGDKFFVKFRVCSWLKKLWTLKK